MRIPIDGLRVGNYTDTEARTGCTVLLFPEGTVASGEVRGGAPATREFDLLAPERAVERLDALRGVHPTHTSDAELEQADLSTGA